MIGTASSGTRRIVNRLSPSCRTSRPECTYYAARIHSDLRATHGFADPDAYDRGRPPFPRDGVAAVLDALGLDRQSTVLDVGAGTGKLTQELVHLVGQVIAVEPAPPMLAVLRQRLPSVDAPIGAAEGPPVAGRC